MMTITRRDIEAAHRMARRARDEAQKQADHAAYRSGQIAQSLEVVGASAATGFLYGRFGPPPFQLDLLTGVLLQGLAYYGAAGKYSHHLHNLGDGMLGFWAGIRMAGVGAQMKGSPFTVSAAFLGEPSSGGAFGQSGSEFGGVSQQELAAMAQAWR